jgi:hypothetical protein
VTAADRELIEEARAWSAPHGGATIPKNKSEFIMRRLANALAAALTRAEEADKNFWRVNRIADENELRAVRAEARAAELSQLAELVLDRFDAFLDEAEPLRALADRRSSRPARWPRLVRCSDCGSARLRRTGGWR